LTKIAIIGGTGLTQLEGLKITGREVFNTPYGEPSGHVVYGRFGKNDIVFLPRHGHVHKIPPHKINYRANLFALRECGVEKIIAIAAVGGISLEATPGQLVIPNQIIDYTYAREHTFFDGGALFGLDHIDFTEPFSIELRQALIAASIHSEINSVNYGVYAATQGPRLESAAEIDRLEKDGCSVVGMTAMPEAALARELEIEYASCNLVVNWAAGRGEQSIHADIEEHIEMGMVKVRKLLIEVLNRI